MLDNRGSLLKIICLALAALLLARIVPLALHSDPLGSATVPPLPTLTTVRNDERPKEISHGTNAAKKVETNALAKVVASKHHASHGFPMGGPPMALNLSPGIQARVDKIKESEILGPFMRPPPMALLGIADDDAFLRAPDGQTGMVKEGDELGGVKLLRIGVNRVLVEENGEKKELTLFSGLGGESLMPKDASASTNVMPDQKENP